ncbi:MAG: hypothetical protein ACREEM_24295 [Blastocatellia bacterium]
MIEIAVIVEAEADAKIVCALADHLLLEEGPSWIEDHLLPVIRNWSGLEEGSAFTKWTSIDDLFGRFPRLRFRRRSSEQKKKPYYAAARKAIILAPLLRRPTPIALILMCDIDSQKERRDGLMQAREDEQMHLTTIIATPNPKREAWVLNGFVCENEIEQAELESIRQEINFDPCQEAHRLRYTSQGSQAARDPKKILARLTAGSRERETQCWTETPLTTLRVRGVETHLNAFLNEVSDRLLPLFSN